MRKPRGSEIVAAIIRRIVAAGLAADPVAPLGGVVGVGIFHAPNVTGGAGAVACNGGTLLHNERGAA